ncbi:MAG: hypothetical protein KDC38_07865 [Planctomycetes bacterium]|nr:hypothetical protein [Planctomycetota bacterium]
MTIRLALLLSGLALLTGCYPSNVLDSGQRAVVEDLVEVEWVAYDASALTGSFALESMGGDNAGAFLELYYYFSPGGHYTGAALIIGPEGPTFQVLSGEWAFVAPSSDTPAAPGELVLDGEPYLVDTDATRRGSRVRIRNEGNEVVLVRRELR